MTVVELRPIVKSIEVSCTPREAFRLFTEEITAWWPLESHSRAREAKGSGKSVRVTIEPRVGGRIYETLQTGQTFDWGEVLAYNPGRLFSMEWQLGRSAEQATEVTVRFEAQEDQRCRVTLTHENWENLGDEAATLRKAYDNGWVTVFERGYGAYVAATR